MVAIKPTWTHRIEHLGHVTTSTITETGTDRPIAKTIIDIRVAGGFIIPYPDCTFSEAEKLKTAFKEQGMKTIVLLREDFALFLEAKSEELNPVFIMAAKHILEAKS